MKEIKKITFLGNFRVDFTSESHYFKTFLKLGYEVMAFQESEAKLPEIRQAAIQSDMFFWVHTHGWQTPGIEILLQELRAKRIPSVGYHLDLWKGIEREADLFTDPYWKIQNFFSVDPEMVEWMNNDPKMPKAFFLPAGVLEEECYLAEPDRVKYPHDIIFVGSRHYHEEWPYRPKLIEWLEKTYGDKFAQYGKGGRPGPSGDQIRGRDLNVLYASAKIVIGDTLCPGFNKPYYLSDRIFETTGRGGFIIHPYIEGIEDFFNTRGTSNSRQIETYTFNDFEELKNKIDFYLTHDTERESIRLNGQKETMEGHTYTGRLQKLIWLIEDNNE